MTRFFGVKDYTLRHLELYINRYKSRVNETKIRIVAKLLGEIGGKKLLDIGCGCGIFSNHCYAQGARVYSIDFSPLMTSYVKSTNVKLNVCQASAEHLCYRDTCFDIVLCLDVIEHLYRPNLLLKEVGRVLKKNGRFILVTDNTSTLPQLRRLASIYSRILRKIFKSLPQSRARAQSRELSRHVKVFKADEILGLITKHKFRILDYDTFSNVPLFNVADRLLAVLFRGSMRKYKWNRVYFHVIKSP